MAQAKESGSRACAARKSSSRGKTAFRNSDGGERQSGDGRRSNDRSFQVARKLYSALYGDRGRAAGNGGRDYFGKNQFGRIRDGRIERKLGIWSGDDIPSFQIVLPEVRAVVRLRQWSPALSLFFGKRYGGSIRFRRVSPESLDLSPPTGASVDTA